MTRVPLQKALEYAVYLYEKRKYEKAERTLLQIMETSPRNSRALNILGNVYWSQGKAEVAEALYREAIEGEPLFAEAYNNLGNALKDQGRIKEAEEAYREAIRIKPTLADTYRHITQCRKYSSADDEDVKSIEALLKRDHLSTPDRAYLFFALGKIFDDCGMFKEAFGFFEKGNLIKHHLMKPDLRPLVNFVNRTIKTFTEGFFGSHDRSGLETRLPVFIVGMPRSGTTLVEQIIAAHPRAYGVGELDDIERIANETPGLTGKEGDYLEAIKMANHEVLKRQGESYLSIISEKCKKEKVLCIADKMPANFLFLGFIALIFPKVKIVHCLRNGMDTCLSNYFTCFHAGGQYSYDPETLGRYFREYRRLMNHWKECLPLEIFDIHYEALVYDSETNIPKLLDFLELDRDDRCFSFYKQKKIVRTASNWQVRRPIYRGSVNKWKHYEAYLGDLKRYI